MTREALYEFVWSGPVDTNAAKIGLSGSYVARICRVLDVPRPPPGYWQRLPLGRAPPRPPLPHARPGTPTAWVRGTSVERPPRCLIGPPPKAKPPSNSRRPDRRQTHSLVRVAGAHLRSAELDGAEYLRPRKKLLADISASKGGLDRCLRFADALFTELEFAGHRVLISHQGEKFVRIDIDGGENPRVQGVVPAWWPIRPTVVYIGGIPIGLAVIEASECVRRRYVGHGRFIRDSDYRPDVHVGHTWQVDQELPSGRVKLTAYSPFHPLPWAKHWIEREDDPLGKQLETIVVALESAAIDLGGRLRTVNSPS